LNLDAKKQSRKLGCTEQENDEKRISLLQAIGVEARILKFYNDKKVAGFADVEVFGRKSNEH
jgi:hypothetical protein